MFKLVRIVFKNRKFYGKSLDSDSNADSLKINDSYDSRFRFRLIVPSLIKIM